MTCTSGSIAIVHYLSSLKPKREFDKMLMSKYNKQLDLSWNISNGNYGVGLVLTF